MSKELNRAKRYLADASRKKSKGKKRSIDRRFGDLLKAVRQMESYLRKL